MSYPKLPSLIESPVWHPYTGVPHQGPRELLVRAEGAYVYDGEGRRYFDATSSWWCNLHGHCHPAMVAALQAQAPVLDQILFAPHEHPPALKLAEKLLERAGKGFSKVFFSDDGSTAVEAALKMALQYWHLKGECKRRLFLSMDQAYHGDTLGAIAVGHLDEFHHYFPQTGLPTIKATAPYCYRCPLDLAFPSCGVACLARARQAIEEKGDEIAALIVEPLVMGAAGMIIYPREYLNELMALCRSRGILVIFDEVFTGFGRTGSFFAYDQLDSPPDILCLSKGLTGGMLPMGATLASREFFEVFTGEERRKFYHGHTFTANALACAVALESLLLFDRESTLERNAALSRFMQSQSERFMRLPIVGDVRSLGMIWAMELVQSKETKAPFSPANLLGWKIAEQAWKSGVWLRPMGSVLYVVPPYCSSETELQEVFDVLYRETESAC